MKKTFATRKRSLDRWDTFCQRMVRVGKADSHLISCKKGEKERDIESKITPSPDERPCWKNFEGTKKRREAPA